MKRILSIFLASLLILSSSAFVFAEETEFIVNGESIINAKTFQGIDLNVSSEGKVALAGGSYAEYDLSAVDEGIYDVKINYSSQDAKTGYYFNFYMGDSLVKKALLKNTESLSTYIDLEIGTIKVEAGKNLKVLCTSYNGKRVNLANITFTKNEEGTITDDFRLYADNATISDSTLIPVNGVDFFDAEGAEYTSGTVTVASSELAYKTRTQNNDPDEWTRYDVKGVKGGTYEVTVNAGVRSESDLYFYVGDKNALSGEPQVILDCAKGNNGGSSYTVVDNVINLYIPYNAEYLYVKSTGKTASVRYFDFKYLTDVVTITGKKVVEAKDALGNDLEISGSNVRLLLGSYAEFDLSDIKPGVYDVTINYSTHDTSRGFYYNVYVGERLVNKLNLPNTGGNDFLNIDAGTVEINEGENLKILNTSTTVATRRTDIGSITFTPREEAPAFSFRQYADNATYSVVESEVIRANNVDYLDTDGAAYSSNTSGDGTYGIRVQNDTEPGEWTRYDIKGLKSGTYEVTVLAGVRSASDLNFYVGDEDAISGEPQVVLDCAKGNNGGTSYTVVENVIKLVIPYNAEYLYVRSTGKTANVHYYDFRFLTDDIEIAATDAKEAKNISGEDIDLTGGTVRYYNGSYATYDLSDVKPGLYDLTLNYSTYNTARGFYFNVYSGDRLESKVKIENSGGDSSFADAEGGTIEIKEGESLKISASLYNDKRINLRTIVLSPNNSGDASYGFRQYADNVTVSEVDGAMYPLNDVDYFDTDGASFTTGTVLESTSLGTYGVRVQNDTAPGEWSRYDIKGLKSGIYEVTVLAGVRSASDLSFYVGGEDALSGEPQAVLDCANGNNGGTSYTVVENVINIPVSEGAEYLYVKSTGKTAKVHYFDFKFVKGLNEEDAPLGVTFTADEEGKEEIAEIGENTTIYANVCIGENEKATVVIAKYNSDGFVLCRVDQDAVIENSKVYPVEVASGDKVKVFVWEDIDTSLIPLCKEGIIE